MPTDFPPRSVFLVSPIGEDGTETQKRFDRVKRYLVEKAFPVPQYSVQRADDNQNPGHITPQIIASIRSADLVVIDLSTLNPNVFYEAAVVHGYGAPAVHIMTKGERLPSDVKDMRTVFYDTTILRSSKKPSTYCGTMGCMRWNTQRL